RSERDQHGICERARCGRLRGERLRRLLAWTSTLAGPWRRQGQGLARLAALDLVRARIARELERLAADARRLRLAHGEGRQRQQQRRTQQISDVLQKSFPSRRHAATASTARPKARVPNASRTSAPDEGSPAAMAAAWSASSATRGSGADAIENQARLG